MRVYTMSKNIVFIVDLEETYHQGIIETKKRNGTTIPGKRRG